MMLARPLSLLAALLILAACATPQLTRPAALPIAQLILDSGDQLRITVLDQPDLGGTYTVDEAGMISMPLVGSVGARGRTAEQLEAAIAAAYRNGYLRNPDVTVQVEAFRPIFVMGEVATSGQYAYVAGLTVQQAIAIAGGFTPRANQFVVDVVRRTGATSVELRLEMLDWVMPGDTITVRQRLI
jgi:polysaccharide biosynthesis/export protein